MAEAIKKRIAIIDTGSNTIRLAIFEIKISSSFSFKELLDKKSVAGLSAYVEDGILTKPGIDRACNSLKYQIKRVENLRCDELYIFATAVLRNCKNRDDVVKKIQRAIDHKIEILSGGDEARLGILGATYNTDIDSGVMIDLGGGSCEITNFSKNTLKGKSLKIGCVSSFAKYVKGIFPTKDEFNKIKDDVTHQFRDGGFCLGDIDDRDLYCIGGSGRAISKMVGVMSREMKWPKNLKYSDLKQIEELLFSDQDTFAHFAVAANADRVHSLAPGVAIIQSVMENLDKDELTLCKRGLREGYLIDKLNVH